MAKLEHFYPNQVNYFMQLMMLIITVAQPWHLQTIAKELFPEVWKEK